MLGTATRNGKASLSADERSRRGSTGPRARAGRKGNGPLAGGVGTSSPALGDGRAAGSVFERTSGFGHFSEAAIRQTLGGHEDGSRSGMVIIEATHEAFLADGLEMKSFAPRMKREVASRVVLGTRSKSVGGRRPMSTVQLRREVPARVTLPHRRSGSTARSAATRSQFPPHDNPVVRLGSM